MTSPIHLELAEKLIRLEKEALARSTAEAELPHLYGWKWYQWALDFFESTNQINLLCAANQISKSSTQIRKAIDWATNVDKWSSLWRLKPMQFWYLYPSQPVVNAEFLTKWSQFLPKGKMKNDERYGWKEIKKHGDTVGIEFNTGVFLFFKTYAKDVQNLQTGTCDAIFCDEELPFELYDELMLRISACDGYFHMVFTATLGQDEWRRAMEPSDKEEEFLPQAFKQTVSLYDAMFYTDGTPSHWTAEKIAAVKARCGTEAAIMKRVYGKFIVLGGKIYEAFDITKHVKPKKAIPEDWFIYGGVDIGSGNESKTGAILNFGGKSKKNQGHPSAIAFVAVRSDFRQGRVFLGWRGDGVITTAGDVVTKYIELKNKNNIKTVDQRYDWGSADFFQIATSMNEHFEKANKNHDFGFDTINTLFKNDMLTIDEDTDGELGKLVGELASLLHATSKKTAKDDFADALRYCVATIPWDFSWVSGKKKDSAPAEPVIEKFLTPEERQARDVAEQIKQRREAFDDKDQGDEIDQELSEYNDMYGS